MKPIILFGAGKIGISALKRFGPQNISCFVDNNPALIGSRVQGKPVLSIGQLLKLTSDYDLIITAQKKHLPEISRQLEHYQLNNFRFIGDIDDRMFFIEERKELKKYQGMFAGRRCFLIGTGPSLTIGDLEALTRNHEISFASNKIFKLFGQTTWRPNLYCAIDYKVLVQYFDEITRLDIPHMLLSDLKNTEYAIEHMDEKLDRENIDTFNLIYHPFSPPNLPKFSLDPARYVFDAFTVTYSMIQWAVYMGFSEIYLLGVDFTFCSQANSVLAAPHFCADYDKKGEIFNSPRPEHCLCAYKKAKQMSERHNFAVYNATRGGKLEVFPRVDLNVLLNNSKENE